VSGEHSATAARPGVPSTAARELLVVAHNYPPHVGGLEVVAQSEARGMARSGWIVKVLTTIATDASDSGLQMEQGTAVTRLMAWHGLERFGVSFPLFSPALLTSVWRAVKAADLVHVHDTIYLSSWAAALACRLTKTPYVVTKHVVFVPHPSALVRAAQMAVHALIGKRMLAGSETVYAINSTIEADVVRLQQEIKPKTRVLSNGIDTERFRPAIDEDEIRALRTKYGLPTDKVLVLFAGRIVPKKRLGVLLDCDSSNYQVVIAGGLPRTDDDLCSGNIFLGRLDQDQMAEVYRAVNIFVCPSISEFLPLTVLEAAASGLSVVVEDDPDISASVLGERLVRVPDMAENLSAVLDEMAMEAATLRAANEVAVELVREHFSLAAHLRVLERAYFEVLDDGKVLPMATENPDTGANLIRVGVVSPHYPPRIGGVETYAERLAKLLAESDSHDVVVVCANEGRRTVVETRDNVTVHRLGTWFRLSNTPINPLWIWQIPRLLKRSRVDVVSVHSPVPFMADVVAMLSKVRPVVLTYHCRTLLKGGGLADVILRPYEKYVLPRVFRRCEGLVTVSPITINEDFERATLVECGVDVERFVPAAKAPESDPTLVYVGRVERNSRWKGVDVLLHSFVRVLMKVPNARLEIVGAGDWMPDLQELAKELGVADKVVWHGALSGDELTRAYQHATAFVLPSTTDSENFGTVLIEAMACGRPVVATNVGGLRFTVRDGVDGILVPPSDYEALATACVKLLSDPELANRMGAAGRQAAVDTWEWKKLMSKMVSYMDGLVLDNTNAQLATGLLMP
jgi:glycosyltransferase involved in cell wall biosynthesis